MRRFEVPFNFQSTFLQFAGSRSHDSAPTGAARLWFDQTARQLKVSASGGPYAGLSPSISVKAFGAKGDGTTDDTAAIQAAIAATGWPAQAASLSFDPGTYIISSTITLDGGGLNATPQFVIHGNGATLKSNTSGLVLLKLTNSIVSLTRVFVYDLMFYINTPGGGGGTCAVLHNSQLCQFVGCQFLGSYGLGVELTGTSINNRLMSCEWTSMARGILVSGSGHYLQVDGCAFAEQLIGTPLNWIEVTGSSQMIQISDSFFGGSQATLPIIRLTKGYNSQITGCTFWDCHDTGIWLGGAGQADDNLVSGCTMNVIYKHGVVIEGSRCKVTGCTFGPVSVAGANTYDAVHIKQLSGSGGAQNIVTGCTSSDGATTRDFVREDTGANRNLVAGNIHPSTAAVTLVGGASVAANNIAV
jgi:hypothetical protein